jgi:osmotically inducible protein OsmC
MRALYTAEATAHGGREGHVRSSDGILDIDLRPPKEMGGAGGTATNPEQLFAAGYAACFESALRGVARSQKKPLRDGGITARVTLNLTDDKRYLLGVELRGRFEGLAEEDTIALMRAAHDVCPYSNATRGNIEVRLLAESSPVAAA